MSTPGTDAAPIIVRGGRYSQSFLSLTLHDPEVDDEGLLTRVLPAAEATRLDPTVLRSRPELPDGVVGVDVPLLDDEATPQELAAERVMLAQRLGALITAVDPASALVGINIGAGQLVTDDYASAEPAWGNGWVRRRGLDTRRAGLFERFVAQDRAFELGAGVAWTVGGLLDPVQRPSPRDVFGARAYAAYHGRAPGR